MHTAVVQQRDRGCSDGRSIERDARHASATALGVLDQDRVARGTEAPLDREAGPRGRDTRLEAEARALSAQSDDAFERDTIPPTRRARVPGPPASSTVG